LLVSGLVIEPDESDIGRAAHVGNAFSSFIYVH